MARGGPEDVFERRYTAKFCALVAEFGEFVTYERDRGALRGAMRAPRVWEGGVGTDDGLW